MKNARSKLIIMIVLVLPLELSAAQNTIRLICKYTHTIDDQGKRSDTSGEDLVTVNILKNGRVTIKRGNLRAEFSGTINDEKIYGEAKYNIQDSIIRETLMINRYTGAFENTNSMEGSKIGLFHFGKCKPATEKLF